jgi:hypothetical protein
MNDNTKSLQHIMFAHKLIPATSLAQRAQGFPPTSLIPFHIKCR